MITIFDTRPVGVHGIDNSDSQVCVVTDDIVEVFAVGLFLILSICAGSGGSMPKGFILPLGHRSNPA